MGLLDAPMRSVAQTLTHLFTDDALVFDIKTNVYNPLTGANVPTTVTKPLIASPPYSFTEQEVADYGLARTDLKVIVAALDYEAAGVNLHAESEKQVFCTRSSIRYRAIYVKPINSGDQEAAIILALRL